MTTDIRYFKPVYGSKTSVLFWYWRRSTGLRAVVQSYGTVIEWRSEYGTLRAFLKAIKFGREVQCEEYRAPDMKHHHAWWYRQLSNRQSNA